MLPLFLLICLPTETVIEGAKIYSLLFYSSSCFLRYFLLIDRSDLMIDTMLIFYPLSKWEYDDLFSGLIIMSYHLNGKKLYKDRNDKNTYVTHCLSKNGLQEIKLRHNREKNYRAIEIRLRPKLLADEGNYFDLFHLDEFEQARQTFNQIFAKFNYLPDLIYWHTKRVDAAVDLEINEDDILNYMLLFNKCNIPSYMLKNKVTERFMNSIHNLYLCSKNVTINIYSRYRVTQNKVNEGYLKNVNIEPTKNKLRVEVQYKNCTGKLHQFLNRDFLKMIILRFFDETIGSGDYYHLSDALRIIQSSVRSIKKWIRIRRLIILIHESGSIVDAKSIFLKKSANRTKASKEFSSLIQNLRSMNINPVCIPEQLRIDKIDGIRNLIIQKFQ